MMHCLLHVKLDFNNFLMMWNMLVETAPNVANIAVDFAWKIWIKFQIIVVILVHIILSLRNESSSTRAYSSTSDKDYTQLDSKR